MTTCSIPFKKHIWPQCSVLLHPFSNKKQDAVSWSAKHTWKHFMQNYKAWPKCKCEHHKEGEWQLCSVLFDKWEHLSHDHCGRMQTTWWKGHSKGIQSMSLCQHKHIDDKHWTEQFCVFSFHDTTKLPGAANHEHGPEHCSFANAKNNNPQKNANVTIQVESEQKQMSFGMREETGWKLN